jgi:hypothetical protein
MAARAYMVPQDPRVLFETARALRCCASEHCGYQLAVMFRQKTEGGSGRTQIPMSLERKTLC